MPKVKSRIKLEIEGKPKNISTTKNEFKYLQELLLKRGFSQEEALVEMYYLCKKDETRLKLLEIFMDHLEPISK